MPRSPQKAGVDGRSSQRSCRQVSVGVVSVGCFYTHGDRRTAESDRAYRAMRGHLGMEWPKFYLNIATLSETLVMSIIFIIWV